MKRRKLILGNTFLDDRGITLPRVILASVLALAAAAVGVIIYNAIRGRSEQINDAAAVLDELRDAFDEDRAREERQRLDLIANDRFEDDGPVIPVLGDGISDRLYLDEFQCPNLETRHWHSLIENGKDASPNKNLLPARKETSTSSIIQVNKQNPTLININRNWIEADGSTVQLSPEPQHEACVYRSTPDYLPKITDVSNVPNLIVGDSGNVREYSDISYGYNIFDLSTLDSTTTIRSNIEPPLWESGCLRSGLHLTAHVSNALGVINRGCLLYLSRVSFPDGTPTARKTTAKIGVGQRASSQLISYCAIYGGYIPFVPIPHSSTETYETTDFNKCVVNPERYKRTCTLFDLGLFDSKTNRPLIGFSIAPKSTNSNCTIQESSKEAGKIAISSTERLEYLRLGSLSSCPKWKIGPFLVNGTNNLPYYPACVYGIQNATEQFCSSLGLLFFRTGICYYFYAASSPFTCDYHNHFSVDKTTGKGMCRWFTGQISERWHSLCTGWNYTSLRGSYDHDNDDPDKDGRNENGDPATPEVPDDDSSVYAYYSQETNTYHCSFKNRYLNSARECLSFGYQPGVPGECEVVDVRTYNPAPYAPTCAVMRAAPYFTSQEQLFSISSLNLAFQNKSARQSANSELGVQVDFATIDNNDFLYDRDNNVLPNINGQLNYYYDRLIKPAVEAYLTGGGRYNELWLPSQFPTGNVSWSRTFGQQGYPAVTSQPDPTETSPLDFVNNRRSPNSTSNCDDYKQFYHPLHIEKSAIAQQEYTVGYNDQNKATVCGISGENFWEPRYYLDVLAPGTTYSGNYCSNTTTACSAPLAGSQLYRECSLVGTDTMFTRPAEISNSSFNFSNDINNPLNSYIKECEDLGYSGGNYELYDYKLLSEVDEKIHVALSQLDSNETIDWVSPANNFRNYNDGAWNNNSYGYYDLWVRSDARETRIGTNGPQFYLLGGQSVNPEDKTADNRFEAEGGLVWSRYGMSEMVNHIQRQQIRTGANSRAAVLRFSNPTLLTDVVNQSTLTNFSDVPFNPDIPTVEGKAGYLAGGEWSRNRGGSSSNLTFYAPYAELNCEFRVPATAPAEVQAFFRACQSLSSYYFTRFSYHKPIEVKDFNVEDITFLENGTLPTGDNFGHWREGLLTENDEAKHPSLIKYGNASYNVPTYFHIDTNKDNGYFYCEANPDQRFGYGDILTRALPTAKRTTTQTVTNVDCVRLNAIIGAPFTAATFETISEMSNNAREIKAASELGFIGHKEGPYDFYPCKWRAPFKGNPLAE